MSTGRYGPSGGGCHQTTSMVTPNPRLVMNPIRKNKDNLKREFEPPFGINDSQGIRTCLSGGGYPNIVWGKTSEYSTGGYPNIIRGENIRILPGWEKRQLNPPVGGNIPENRVNWPEFHTNNSYRRTGGKKKEENSGHSWKKERRPK